MARALGLDIGNRFVGVALSDESGLLARPLEVLDRGRSGADDATVLDRLAALAATWRIDRIVAGEPRRTDGRASEQAAQAAAFAARVGAHLALPLHRMNEQYSSQEAQAILGARKARRQGEQGRDDAVAAAVILQRFLNAERPESPEE